MVAQTARTLFWVSITIVGQMLKYNARTHILAIENNLVGSCDVLG